MFKNKKTKQQSVNVVDSLLSNYLQVSDKQILKNKEKGNKEHVASKILEVNSKMGNFKQNRDSLKKHKQKERKMRNREMKKIEKINEKIIRQSKIDNDDELTINKIMNEKISNLKKIDLVSTDSDLINLQNEILGLTNVESTKSKIKDLKDRKLQEQRRRIEDEQLFGKHVSKGSIQIKGLTPGLAQPGDDDDSEEEEDEGNGGQLAGFKDDFDDFN